MRDNCLMTPRPLHFLACLLIFSGLAGTGTTAVNAQCRLCAEQPALSAASKKSDVPLRISISTELDFARLALTGPAGGQVTIDPETGVRSTTGQVVALSGMALTGRAEIIGGKNEKIRIDIPASILLTAPDGGTAELTQIETDLPNRPKLDKDGRLLFTFGGLLRVKNSSDGQFRGRIPITVDYE
jgi:hypothetical protein